MKRNLAGSAWALGLALVGAIAQNACDGTLTGLHRRRGVLPAVSAEPVSSAELARAREPREVRAQHLVVMHRASPSAPVTVTRTREEARARAEEALAKIKAGANFDEVAGEYSDEPGAAERGGDLGRFSRKQMVRPFAEAAFKLEPGQISNIVETDFGFHVIRRTE
jgi:NIMA-interacting peptidyl-prolyl cis-trans isomerase 1